jgi:hypothetical protein
VTGPVLGGFREAEEYTGLSRRTLGRLLPSIAHIRIGSRVLFEAARHRVPARPPRKTADLGRIVEGLRRGRG